MERLKIPAHSDFYPRSPCGERHEEEEDDEEDIEISIHALLAESDKLILTTCWEGYISIHALLAESDVRGTS